MQYKRLRIFDFDDTLVKTDSYVYVNNGDSQIKLTPVNMLSIMKKMETNLIFQILKK